jgi:hypothetical protein
MTDEALLALVETAFAFLCERKMGELVDLPELLRAVDATVADEGRIARVLARLVAPGRARLLERARASETRLGAWLPDDVRASLAELLGRPAPIPRRVIDEAVASEQVREAVRAMLQETLTNFLDRAFAVAPGGAGLRGMLGWGARAAGAAGRGLLGGLGGELQRQLEERVRDFIDGAVAMVQTRIADRLASDDTAALLGRRRRQAFEALLGLTEGEAAARIERLPLPLLDALAPRTLTHNLRRREVREAVRAELHATFAELSHRTLGAILDELGLRDRAAAALRMHALPLGRAFLASPEYQRWLANSSGGGGGTG